MEEIVDETGLSVAMAASRENPVFLFKHSTTCPISAAAYREVAGYVKGGGDGGARTVYLVKVIESRPVSNAISSQTGVQHQSPQLILLDGGAAVWDASHSGISGARIVEAAAAVGRD